MPSAMSSAIAPVEIESIPHVRLSPIFIPEPLPNCFSIWLSAASSAFSRSIPASLSDRLASWLAEADPTAGGYQSPGRSYFQECSSANVCSEGWSRSSSELQGQWLAAECEKAAAQHVERADRRDV